MRIEETGHIGKGLSAGLRDMSSELQKGQDAELKSSQPPEALLVPGFEILEVLGTGGAGVVYKARQLGMDRVVALKVLHRHLLNDVTPVQRFLQEARLSTLLDHPNIATVYAFGTTADGTPQPYLAMEYCKGETLKDMMDKQRVEWAEMADIFQQICLGLAHAHSHGVIHRDLKPANVFIRRDESGRPLVKLIDFGIAKLELGQVSEAQKLTRTGVVLGTPIYMSPEQCTGGKVDARSDIYSLGCMLYHVVSGRPPFSGETTFEIAGKHLSELAPRMAKASRVRVSIEVEKLVAKAIAKNPDDRFQSALEFRDALKPLSGTVRQLHSGRHFSLPQVSGQTLKVAFCLIAVPFLIGVAAFIFSGRQQPHSVAFEEAHALFNKGPYESAFPKLLALSDAMLSDQEATGLLNDLADLAVMLKDDGRKAGELKTIDKKPFEVVAEAITEPTANHPGKFTACRAQLIAAGMSGSARQGHIINSLNLSGLAPSEYEYCKGYLEYLEALNKQYKGKYQAAAQHYEISIQHLKKANDPAVLVKVYGEAANCYSDGAHADGVTRCTDSELQLLPNLLQRNDRLSARDMVFLIGPLLDARKYDEADKVLTRAGEIYAKQAGGANDMAMYYRSLVRSP